MPAQRRLRARKRVPRPAVRAQRLQLLEISNPRRCLTKAFSTRQATSPLQALQRAQASELYGFFFTKLHKPKPRRRHRVAHRTAHRWEPCEIEILRSQNVRDDEVVGEAGDGFLSVSKARGSSGDSETADRGSHGGMRDVGGHVEGVVCASLCVEASEKSVTVRTIR